MRLSKGNILLSAKTICRDKEKSKEALVPFLAFFG